MVWHDWPLFPGQLQAFDDCIERHREDARWIAFVDADEFLFSPTMRPVSEILRDFEQFPGVGVNCLTFGTNGHQTPPPGLVIDNYRAAHRPGAPRTDHQEHRRARRASCTRAASRTTSATSSARRRVTERREQIAGDETDAASYDLLRINHYFTRSQIERDAKIASARADNGLPRRPDGQATRPDAGRGRGRDDPRLPPAAAAGDGRAGQRARRLTFFFDLAGATSGCPGGNGTSPYTSIRNFLKRNAS